MQTSLLPSFCMLCISKWVVGGHWGTQQLWLIQHSLILSTNNYCLVRRMGQAIADWLCQCGWFWKLSLCKCEYILGYYLCEPVCERKDIIFTDRWGHFVSPCSFRFSPLHPTPSLPHNQLASLHTQEVSTGHTDHFRTFFFFFSEPSNSHHTVIASNILPSQHQSYL